MFNLDKNWLTNDPLDFEYKSYLILDYEQKINNKIKSRELYPYFDDLLEKLKEAKCFVENKKIIDNRNIKVNGIDIPNQKLLVSSTIMNDRIEFFGQIAEFALNKFKSTYITAERIFEEIYRSIKIFDLNLHQKSLNFNGTLIVQNNDMILTYRYMLHKFIDEEEYTYDIDLDFIEERKNSTKYIDSIRSDMSNNVFLVKTTMKNLHHESFIRVLKKKLINYISNNID